MDSIWPLDISRTPLANCELHCMAHMELIPTAIEMAGTQEIYRLIQEELQT